MKTEYKSEGDKMTVFLSGEIDHHCAKRISQDVDTKIAIFKPKTVFLDFSDVSFMDSSGLALVVGRKRMCDRIKSDFYISNISGYPRKILIMAGADKLVKFTEE